MRKCSECFNEFDSSRGRCPKCGSREYRDLTPKATNPKNLLDEMLDTVREGKGQLTKLQELIKRCQTHPDGLEILKRGRAYCSDPW